VGRLKIINGGGYLRGQDKPGLVEEAVGETGPLAWSVPHRRGPGER